MEISVNFSAPTKATSGIPAYSPALYQIQSAIAKLLVSFWCQVKIRKVKPGRQRGAKVAVGDDGGRVMVQEWNRDRLSQGALFSVFLKTGSVDQAESDNND